MMTASTISSLMDLPLLGAVPEDEVVRRAMLRHTLFIQYDCEARSALLRIGARVMGRSIPVFEYGGKKDRHARALFVRGRFSGKMKEATMLDDH